VTTEYVETRMIPLAQLTPFPGNARRGDPKVLAESLDENGQYRSLIVRREPESGDLIVLCGNNTLEALEARGDETARCEVHECDDRTALRINLIDNKSNDRATYDDQARARLLALLDGELYGTGYDEEEVDSIIARFEESGFDGLADDPVTLVDDAMDGGYTEPGDVPVPELVRDVVTQPGDVWILGSHRMMCGDARNPDDVHTLLAGDQIHLAFTSPPYASQRDYDVTTEFRPVPPDEYVAWFEPVARSVADHLTEDGSWFVNIKASADGLDTHLYVHDLVIAHARMWGWHYATELCWRRIGVPKSVTMRFKNQFEPVYQFTRGRWKMRPDRVRHVSANVPVPGGPGVGDTGWKNQQGAPGSVQFGHDNETSPGLAYPGNMLPTFSGDHQATGHTAAFPVGLPQWFIRVYSDPGDTVYDPFGGSGSTLMACEREGRQGRAMEISPRYCDIAALRFQEATGTIPLRNGVPCPLDAVAG